MNACKSFKNESFVSSWKLPAVTAAVKSDHFYLFTLS